MPPEKRTQPVPGRGRAILFHLECTRHIYVGGRGAGFHIDAGKKWTGHSNLPLRTNLSLASPERKQLLTWEWSTREVQMPFLKLRSGLSGKSTGYFQEGKVNKALGSEGTVQSEPEIQDRSDGGLPFQPDDEPPPCMTYRTGNKAHGDSRLLISIRIP